MENNKRPILDFEREAAKLLRGLSLINISNREYTFLQNAYFFEQITERNARRIMNYTKKYADMLPNPFPLIEKMEYHHYGKLKKHPVTQDDLMLMIMLGMGGVNKDVYTQEDVAYVHQKVCKYFNLDVEANLARIPKTRRHKTRDIEARHITMYLCSGKCSLNTISRVLRMKHHTTVMYATRKVKKEIELYPTKAFEVNKIKTTL